MDGHVTVVKCSERLNHSCCLVTCVWQEEGDSDTGTLRHRADIYLAQPPPSPILLISCLTSTLFFHMSLLVEAPSVLSKSENSKYSMLCIDSISKSLIAEIQATLFSLWSSVEKL